MPPPEDGLNAKSGAEKIKVAKTLRRKDDKSETEIIVLVDSSNEHESIVGWGCEIADLHIATWLPSCLAAKKAAFTLAEVLITLGIIGVVAALTLPTVINKAQSMILKNQFKKAYSTFYNAMKLVQVQNGAPMACWYWDNNPYGSVKCIEENQYGNCTKWTMEDDSPLPSDINGNFSDCRKFSEDLIKTMKVIKFCEKDALKNGCLTESYRGADKVNSERDPNKEQDPNQMFSDSAIKKNYPAFITPDGTLYVRYGAMFGAPIFMVDVNGHKGPNKWGYDIFSFDIIGNPQDGMTNLKGDWYAVEPNGKSFTQMLQSF